MKKNNIFSLVSLAILFIGLIPVGFIKTSPIIFLTGLLLFITSTSISKTIPIHYKLPIVFISLLLVSITFKLMHWTGANLILAFSSFSLVLSLMFYTKKRLSKIDYKTQPYIDIILNVFFIYFIVFALFKILHWPSVPYPSLLSPLYILGIWIIQFLFEIIVIKKTIFAKVMSLMMVALFFSFGSMIFSKHSISKSILDTFKTQTKQGLQQNSSIVNSINDIRTKTLILLFDEDTKEHAQYIQPRLHQIKNYANKIDDYFLAELNIMIEASEGDENWFTRDISTQITSYRNFEELKNPGDYDIPFWFFGGEPGSTSFYRGEELRKMLIEYRNNIIMYFYNSNEKHTTDLTPEKLVFLDNFKTFLNNEECANSDKLINIYKKLTKPKYINQNGEKKTWNVARFYHQPIIGAIGTFTSLRNDIRLSQLDVSKMLLERIDKPMMIDIKTINADGEILKVKSTIAAYDSTKTYTIQETK
jgi:hypothetical protein